MNKNLILILLVLLIFIISMIFYINRSTESFLVNKINNVNNLGIITENKEPEILLVKNFLTREECDHLIIQGEPLLKASTVCSKDGDKVDKSRTSWTASLGKELITENNKDKVLNKIYNRAAEFCMRSVDNIEPIQMVRYKSGQFYNPHYDYLDTNIDIYKKQVDVNGQREITFFIYLNDVPDGVGGETYFPKINKKVKGKKGDAVFWYNMKKNGELDNMTLHGGNPIKSGVKYGLNIWVRTKKSTY